MISPELMSLLEPLERFELIRRRVARLGDRLCDLSYANPYEGPKRTPSRPSGLPSRMSGLSDCSTPCSARRWHAVRSRIV